MSRARPLSTVAEEARAERKRQSLLRDIEIREAEAAALRQQFVENIYGEHAWLYTCIYHGTHYKPIHSSRPFTTPEKAIAHFTNIHKIKGTEVIVLHPNRFDYEALSKLDVIDPPQPEPKKQKLSSGYIVDYGGGHP